MNSEAVSEIVGEMLLLVVVVVLAGVVSSNIAGLIPAVHDAPYIEMLGVEENGVVNVTHIGGEPLDLTNVKLNIDGEICRFNGTSLDCEIPGKLFGEDDSVWELGERLQINESVGEILVVYDDQIVCRMYFR